MTLAFAAAMLPIVGLSSPPPAAAAAITVVDLGTLGGTDSTAYAVNASGQVVGSANFSTAFSWTSGGGMVDLGPVGGGAPATAVNDSGQVVGSYGSAFSWTSSGGLVYLGSLGGGSSSAYAVNASGQVAGESNTASGETHAFSWTSAGGMVDLGTFGGTESTANAVNASGQVVGYAYTTDDSERRAFSWTSAGGMVDLGPGTATAVNDSGQVVGTINGQDAFSWTAAGGLVDIGSGIAYAVNASGQVVGHTGGNGSAFSWTSGGGMVDLGTLGGPYSKANAVNDNGQVVGRADTDSGETHGFSWTSADGMVDLGTFGGTYSSGEAVNNRGQVVGYASTAGDAERHAALWNTLPLPTDTTPPTITITAPQDGASYTVGQAVTANYSCSDASGVQSCIGPVPSGGSVDTSTAVVHSFEVTAIDNAGNTGVATVSYTVLAGNVSQTVTGGGTVTTDPGGVGTSTAVPVQTQIVAPPSVTGTIAVTPGATSTTSPAGYALFGQQLALSGPAGTAASPYVVTFTVDASELVDASGNPVSPADVQVFRNGLLVPDCSTGSGAAPDPCVASRAAGPGGRAVLTVRTSAFSQWNVGRLRYVFTGFNRPVDNPPVVNTANSGSAIPVKFSLGGNRGLNVFAAGSPSSVASACTAGASDPIDQTVTAGGSTLSFDAASGQYNYVWKTDKTWRGCRTLQVRFRDGTQKTALLNFAK